MEYYSAIKKNEMMSFAVSWMHLEIIMLSEESHTEKEKYHMILIICGIFKKKEKWDNWTYLQNQNRLTDLANELMVTRVEGLEVGTDSEFEIDMHYT